MKSLGSKKWAIAEGYIPAYSHGQAPQVHRQTSAQFPACRIHRCGIAECENDLTAT
jgi:hypothetical protein